MQIGVKLQGIKSAQKQVVAGLNYKLLLETDDGLYDATVYSERLTPRLSAPMLHCWSALLGRHDPAKSHDQLSYCKPIFPPRQAS